MIGAELRLKAVHGMPEWYCHHSRIGYGQVKRLCRGLQLVGTGADTLQICKIKRDQLEAATVRGSILLHLRGRRSGFYQIPSRSQDVRTVCRKSSATMAEPIKPVAPETKTRMLYSPSAPFAWRIRDLDGIVLRWKNCRGGTEVRGRPAADRGIASVAIVVCRLHRQEATDCPCTQRAAGRSKEGVRSFLCPDLGRDSRTGETRDRKRRHPKGSRSDRPAAGSDRRRQCRDQPGLAAKRQETRGYPDHGCSTHSVEARKQRPVHHLRIAPARSDSLP